MYYLPFRNMVVVCPPSCSPENICLKIVFSQMLSALYYIQV